MSDFATTLSNKEFVDKFSFVINQLNFTAD